MDILSAHASKLPEILVARILPLKRILLSVCNVNSPFTLCPYDCLRRLPMSAFLETTHVHCLCLYQALEPIGTMKVKTLDERGKKN